MNNKICYLTIDDGPSIDFLEKKELLLEKKIPAIFFCIGKNIEERFDEVVKAVRNGFIIGNHSYSHPHFSDIPIAEAKNQIQLTDALINQVYNKAEKPRRYKWFRFPYGDKGDGKYGYVFKKFPCPKTEQKMCIQQFLYNLGYRQPSFDNITHRYYKKAALLKDIDWHWTFDIMEWSLTMEKPMSKLHNLEKILARMDMVRPADCRGLSTLEKRWMGKPDSDEIILLHDHSATSIHFNAIIDKLLSLPLQFRLPVTVCLFVSLFTLFHSAAQVANVLLC